MLVILIKKFLKLKKYLRTRKIKIIEDCAHAIGAKKNDVYAGNIGDIGCFLFTQQKILPLERAV